MCKEIHLHLTLDDVPLETKWSYLATHEAMSFPEIYPIVHTTQTHFLRWEYAERLFVHAYGKIHEITLGKCEGTNREIRKGHNIEKMLLSGEFNWFR